MSKKIKRDGVGTSDKHLWRVSTGSPGPGLTVVTESKDVVLAAKRAVEFMGENKDTQDIDRIDGITYTGLLYP